MTNVGLLLVGIFVIYIAAADNGLFDTVISVTGTDRMGVAAATTIAAAIPMFFAVGMIRESISINWFTIYQYERMLEGKGFWAVAIIVLIIIAILHLRYVFPTLAAGIEINPQDMIAVGGCIISAIYLGIYVSRRNKPKYPDATMQY